MIKRNQFSAGTILYLTVSLHAGVKISSTRKRDVTSSKWVLQMKRLRAQHSGSWFSAMQRRTYLVLTHTVNQTKAIESKKNNTKDLVNKQA